jgi:hypothetical protein
MSITWEGIVAAAAVSAALIYLLKIGRAAAVKLDRIWQLADSELTHNHGSSIKDDVYGTAIAIGKTQRELDRLAKRVDRIAHVAAKNHPHDAADYLRED